MVLELMIQTIRLAQSLTASGPCALFTELGRTCSKDVTAQNIKKGLQLIKDAQLAKSG